MRIDKCQLGSLGYECNHQRNPKTMRGAKSNALFKKSELESYLPLRCPCDSRDVWGCVPAYASSGVSLCGYLSLGLRP
jgi:hypothetical protein